MLLVGSLAHSHAQNWNEWFRQKRTQIRYLVNQLAALQVYIELGQEGYAIYRDGLQLVGDIKNGDFNLHKDYLGSLMLVNPAIKRYKKVAEIIAFQVRICPCAFLP